MKLNDRQKVMLTPEAITRIEAGYLNLDTGTLTEAGRSAMWLILTEKHGAQFTALAVTELERQAQEEAKRN